MGTLFIDNKMLQLTQQGQCVKIKQREQAAKTVPFRQIKRVVINSNINIESRLLRNLAQQNISVIFINPRKPEQYGQLYGAGHNDASRRIHQMKASENTQCCRVIAHELVQKKINGQRKLLRDMIIKRPQHRFALNKAAKSLRQALNRLQQEAALSIDSLRGIEGSSAAVYFAAFGTLFAESLEFNGRNRRPPKDPVNALLSLSYTLADSLAGYHSQISGYDPMIGFYHKLSWSRHSLSSDLIEPARPVIDGWIIQLFNQRILRKENFTQQNGGCYLDKAGREKFFIYWEMEMKKPVMKIIEKTLKKISKKIQAI